MPLSNPGFGSPGFAPIQRCGAAIRCLAGARRVARGRCDLREPSGAALSGWTEGCEPIRRDRAGHSAVDPRACGRLRPEYPPFRRVAGAVPVSRHGPIRRCRQGARVEASEFRGGSHSRQSESAGRSRSMPGSGCKPHRIPGLCRTPRRRRLCRLQYPRNRKPPP